MTSISTKNIAAHVASTVAAAGAVLAVVHPGFKIPSATEALATTFCIIVAGVIQIFHAVQHGNLTTRLKVIQAATVNTAAQVEAVNHVPGPPQN